MPLSAQKQLFDKEGKPTTKEPVTLSRDEGSRADTTLESLSALKPVWKNGRWVQDTSLTHAVVQAYHTLLMTGRYPVGFLYLTVPPDTVTTASRLAFTSEPGYRSHSAVSLCLPGIRFSRVSAPTLTTYGMLALRIASKRFAPAGKIPPTT